jgi:polyferredoxin/Na+-translocating ferredoxin:NAD+ oxidoreductase RnfG subunit
MGYDVLTLLAGKSMNKRLLHLAHTAACLIAALLLSAAATAREKPLDAISLEQAQAMFPAAEALGNTEGELPTRRVFGGDGVLGYLFLSDEINPIPAYSGRPIRVLVGLDLDARISSAAILHHEEPILVIGITDEDLLRFVDQYIGLLAREKVRVNAHGRPGYTGVDGITGATITAMVLNSSIMKSAQMVADHLGLPEHREPAAVAAPPPSAAEPTAPEEPVWVERWREQQLELALLVAALFLLMVILFFQDWLVVHPVLFQRLRVGYLLFTLLFLGVYTKAQLSVINLVAFMRVLFGGFTWETLLIDPVIFLLWGFVAVSIILWGRGVFCGWLCPFGALQELIHKVAERFELPNWEFPAMVHERLWAIKYFILIALVGLSLESMTHAARLVEVEPFKTVFVMRFERELWFVAYAVALMVIAVFNSKFYCKYLCPLGAGLSFFTRFRIFDWLRRRKECGKPCQSCAAQCQISAIKPTGEIIDNECHYCLECQVTYWDDQRCPPLVEKRKRQENRAIKADGVIARDQPAG